MARNLESVRTSRLLEEQVKVVERLRKELALAEEELAKRRLTHTEAVWNSENWI